MNPNSLANLRPFPKGVSGNPNGRAKTHAALARRCRAIVDEKVVAFWEEQVDNRTEYAVRCSELLAAYGYGRPKDTPPDAEADAEREPTQDEAAAAAAELRRLNDAH